MWLSMLKSAEWKPFKDLLSPSFLEVVPATVLFGQASALTRNYRDEVTFAAAKSARSQTLAAAQLPVDLVAKNAPASRASVPQPESTPEPITSLGPGLPATLPRLGSLLDPERRGSVVLELYFHQVLSGQAVLLDLRSAALAQHHDRLAWSPAPVYTVFEPEFHAGLSQLYGGFYADDPAAFSAGAAQLGLGKAEAAMRKQFGDDDQTKVKFSLREFQRRFHDVFLECKATKSKLHPQFIALGIGLSTLYAHLEELGGTHDARGAFLRAAAGLAPPKPAAQR